MLRSFDYAAWAALDRVSAEGAWRPRDRSLRALRWRDRQVADFIAAYREIAGRAGPIRTNEETADGLLDLFLLQQGVLRAGYEIGSRPGWLSIPTARDYRPARSDRRPANERRHQVHPSKQRGPAPTPRIEAIVGGRHGDPFGVLGPHAHATVELAHQRLRCPMPTTVEVHRRGERQRCRELDKRASRPASSSARSPAASPQRLSPAHSGAARTPGRSTTPIAFRRMLGELDLHLLAEGTHLRALRPARRASRSTIDGVDGVALRRVGAERAAASASSANSTAGTAAAIPCAAHPGVGVWDIFVPGLAPGDLYKYELLGADGALLPLKADPVGIRSELPPATASRRRRPAALRLAATTAGWTGAAPRKYRSAPDLDLRGASRLVAARRRATASSTTTGSPTSSSPM